MLHKRFSRPALLTGMFTALAAAIFYVPYVSAQNYGSGNYGSCTYNGCGITITSDGTVSLNVTPGGSTTCTVQSETVGVNTQSTTGYTVTLSDTDADNSMAGSNGGTITAANGTYASPSALTANKWGYRVDNRGSFGAGPTSAVTNAGVPSATFARTPALGSADTIISSNGPANPTANTTVWYGLCANSSLPSGTYTDDVIYTAVVND